MADVAERVDSELPKSGPEETTEKMPVVSKEVPKDENSPPKGNRILSVIFKVLGKVCMVGAVYAIGYLHWSIGWLQIPVLLSVARDVWRHDAEVKRSVTRMAATLSEEEIIMAKMAKVQDLPAWIYFPDFDRAEWLNRIIKQLWPNVNNYTKDMLKKKVEPAIAKKLAKKKLNGFQFNRLILGSIPPRIGGVKVYDKNIPRTEIMMDIDLFYAGDCDISFSVAGVSGGIKDLQINGMMRVILKPLIDSVPLVGGVQVFFLNNPSIDFNLVGIADILDMPGLSDILRRVVVEQVSDIMVLPNKLPIKLSDKVPSHDLKMLAPEGVLRIHVVEAKDLMKKDISVLGKGKSDPYAVITIGAQQFKTPVIDNKINPKWDYWCEFPISYTLSQKLDVELFDKDDGSKDEKLGRCTIDISTIAEQASMDSWFTLEDAKHGMVHLRMFWYNLSYHILHLPEATEEMEVLEDSLSTAILSIYVDSCKFLPNARVHAKPDCYLVVKVGKRSENSSVQMRTIDPIFDISYTFLVGNPKSDTLHITVMDQKTEKQLGTFSYNLSHLVNENDNTSKLQPYPLRDAGSHSKIYLSMKLGILVDPTSEPTKADLTVEPSMPPPVQDENHPQHEFPEIMPVGQDFHPSVPALLPHQKSIDNEALISKESTTESLMPPMKKTPPHTPLLHRNSTVTSSAGEAGLGRIQLTLRYSVQRQRLVVVVHKISNIPLKDPSNIPDPYVKLYLLPSRSKDSKRKTAVMKDNCNPVYDETFEYTMSQGEVHSQQLEVTVATQKGFLSGGSPVIGQVIINLAERDLSQAQTWWFDLLPEVARD